MRTRRGARGGQASPGDEATLGPRNPLGRLVVGPAISTCREGNRHGARWTTFRNGHKLPRSRAVVAVGDSIAVIQATLAPAFLISGTGLLLNFTQTRLFRVIHRA